MNKHTQGPWEAESSIIWSPEGKATIAAVSDPRACKYVGYAPLSLSSPDFSEAIANAKLIAAAPDLLELAHQYASECAECLGDGVSDDTDEPCQGCADIRAVIAKATL